MAHSEPEEVPRLEAQPTVRLELRPDSDRWIAVAVAGLGLREEPLTAAIALESRRLSLPTRDPADRIDTHRANR